MLCVALPALSLTSLQHCLFCILNLDNFSQIEINEEIGFPDVLLDSICWYSIRWRTQGQDMNLVYCCIFWNFCQEGIGEELILNQWNRSHKNKKSSCKLLLEKPILFQASQENNIDTYKSCVLMLRGLQLRVVRKEKKTNSFIFKWINNNISFEYQNLFSGFSIKTHS